MEATILIVEDHPDTLELLRRIIEKEGYKTILANDGEKGLNYARRYRPNLIILDRLLPKINGLQICRKLKEDRVTENIPIIFLTILDAEGDIIDGLKAGADDYIKKPFSPDELSARIHRVLSRYQRSSTADVVSKHLVPFFNEVLKAEKVIINQFRKNQKLLNEYKTIWRSFFPKVRQLEAQRMSAQGKNLILIEIKRIKKTRLHLTRLAKNLIIVGSMIVLVYRIEKDLYPEKPLESSIIEQIKPEYVKIRYMLDRIHQMRSKLNRVLFILNEKYVLFHKMAV